MSCNSRKPIMGELVSFCETLLLDVMPLGMATTTRDGFKHVIPASQIVPYSKEPKSTNTYAKIKS